jgi:hypothetical protein
MVITIIVKVIVWSPISYNQHFLNIFIWAAFSKWKIFDSQQGILKLRVKRYISVPIIIFPILSPRLPTMFSDVSFLSAWSSQNDEFFIPHSSPIILLLALLTQVSIVISITRAVESLSNHLQINVYIYISYIQNQIYWNWISHCKALTLGSTQQQTTNTYTWQRFNTVVVAQAQIWYLYTTVCREGMQLPDLPLKTWKSGGSKLFNN